MNDLNIQHITGGALNILVFWWKTIGKYGGSAEGSEGPGDPTKSEQCPGELTDPRSRWCSLVPSVHLGTAPGWGVG